MGEIDGEEQVAKGCVRKRRQSQVSELRVVHGAAMLELQQYRTVSSWQIITIFFCLAKTHFAICHSFFST